MTERGDESGRKTSRKRVKRRPCACGTRGCYDIPELTKEELKRMKPYRLQKKKR